jgi:DNA-binding response OmpR family regulator
MLRDRLTTGGYSVWRAASGAEAEAIGDEVEPDLVIVDLMLPDTSGLVLCADFRERWQVPIIICTASKRPEDVVLGFKLGADDFVRKPFSSDELEARIAAVLRRTAPHRAGEVADEDVTLIGNLAIDRARCTAAVGGQPVHLTPTEYRLLCALADRPNRVLSSQQLAERVWGSHDPGIARSLQVHIRRMRAKLRAGPVQPPPLVAVRGFGYQLVSEAPRAGAVTAPRRSSALEAPRHLQCVSALVGDRRG